MANRKSRFPLAPEAVEAWELQLPPLVQGCQQLVSKLPEAVEFEILLEYPIPRVGKRIDAVLLMHEVIVPLKPRREPALPQPSGKLMTMQSIWPAFTNPVPIGQLFPWSSPMGMWQRQAPGHLLMTSCARVAGPLLRTLAMY